MIGTITAWALPVLFLLMTFLPLVRNDYWTFRILEYPRLQKLIIGFICLISTFFLRSYNEEAFPYLFGVQIACCLYLIANIYPYTSVAPKEMVQVQLNKKVKESSLKVFTANVLQTNKNHQQLLQQIRDSNPDIIFLVETDHAWSEAVKDLDQHYPYTMKKPLSNTYGLLFFSRLPLRNNQILFRADNDVPSIVLEAKLLSGEWIKIYGLHPKPPIPNEALYSTAKDKELMKVAFEVKNENRPCIVMGDLNDVAWSHVTKLFRKVSGLLDPRRGRGFYSTFSAKSWLMRFPLDYIFCSSHFGLVEMKRMPYNGSDHFAMFIHLQYDPSLARVQEEPKADEENIEEAAEKASKPVPAA